MSRSTRRAIAALGALASSACLTLLGAEDDYRLDEAPGPPASSAAPAPELKTPCSRPSSPACEAATEVPRDRIDLELRRTYCRALERCQVLAAKDEQACLDQVTWDWLWPAQAAVEAGAVGYDGRQLRCCLDELEAMACTEVSDQRLLRELPRCRRSFPAAGRGLGCFDGLECDEQEFCDLSSSCPGTCRPRLSSGAGCTVADSCVLGASCLNGVCTGRLCPGKPCEEKGDLGCTSGTVCRPASPTASLCLPPPAAGEYCELATAECDGQTRCRLGAVAKNNQCATPAGEAGDGCRSILDCQPGAFCAGSAPDRQCAAQRAEGQACSPPEAPEVAQPAVFAQQCRFPLHCLDGAGGWTCRGFASPAEASGQACHGTGNDCPDGYFCFRAAIDAAPSCQPTLGSGSVCAHDSQCSSGHCRLDNRTCAPRCRRP